MAISIKSQKGLPIYYQIIEQIKHRIAIKELNPDDRLPTVRQLAVQLSVNPNTVAKAYTELEREGIIQTKQGIGTFVRKSKNILNPGDRKKKLDTLCDQFIADAQVFGFYIDELIKNLKSRETNYERK